MEPIHNNNVRSIADKRSPGGPSGSGGSGGPGGPTGPGSDGTSGAGGGSGGKGSGWTLDESYDPRMFYCRATDTRGHSTYSRLIRMPPPVVEQIESLVHSREFPAYKSPADFYRDAATHRLAYLREHASDPKIRERCSEIIRRIHLEEVTTAYIAELNYFDDIRDRIKDLAERALNAGDTTTLGVYLNRLREDIDSMRDPFRGQLLELIEEVEARL